MFYVEGNLIFYWEFLYVLYVVVCMLSLMIFNEMECCLLICFYNDMEIYDCREILGLKYWD